MASTNLEVLTDFSLLLQCIFYLALHAISPRFWPADAAQLEKLTRDIPALAQKIITLLPGAFTEQMTALQAGLIVLANSDLGVLGADAGNAWHAILLTIFNAYRADLAANKETDPAQADSVVTAALARASYLGLGSRAVTVLFEAFLPKRFNVLNWLGPTLAQLSGYDEIVARARAPQYQHAFGNLSEYDAAQTFLTKAPAAAEARSMLARRLISALDATKIQGWGGTMTAYQAAQEQEAYRPVQPFLLTRMAEAGAIPAADLTALFQFAGFRDVDITRLQAGFVALALVPYQQQYLVASVRSTELGTMTPAELSQVMTDINLTQDQQAIVQLTVATRKLEQLAELYRKSISEAYRYGQITDDQYVPALEAIGIGAADAQAHYAIDSIALRGRTALAAARAEARLEASRTRAATAAAVASYRTGTLDEAALSAALIAAGVDPEIAAFIVTVQTERRAGPLTFIYGREIGRSGALVLKEKVAAVENQYKKQLIDDATAAAALAELEIPTANANALLADWAALKTKPTTTGELLPR